MLTRHGGASEAVPHRHRGCHSGGGDLVGEGTAQEQGGGRDPQARPWLPVYKRLQTSLFAMEIRTVMQQPSA